MTIAELVAAWKAKIEEFESLANQAPITGGPVYARSPRQSALMTVEAFKVASSQLLNLK